MKKTFIIFVFVLTALMVSTVMLAGCEKAEEPEMQTEVTQEAVSSEKVEETTPEPEEEMDVPDWSIGSYERNVQDTYMCTFVFHADGTFYYSKLNDGSQTAGTWELMEGELEYTVDEETFTAQQYFVFTHYDGFVEQVPFVEDVLYNLQIQGFASNFTHNKEGIIAPEDEFPVTVFEYVLEGDDYSTIKLQHNGFYVDTIDAYYEGTWQKEVNVYTLTPDEEDSTCTLTVADDAMSAVYVSLDGTEYNVVMPMPEGPVVLMTFEGESLTMDVYDDGTCAVLYGGVIAVEGTWSYSNYEFSMTLDGVEVLVAMDEAHAFVFDYSIGDGQINDTLKVEAAVWGAADLTIKTEGEEDAESTEALVVFTGTNNPALTALCYDDGTLEVTMEGYGTVGNGEWSYANYAMSMTINEEEMEVTMNEEHAFVFELNIGDGQLVDTMICPSDIWGVLTEG